MSKIFYALEEYCDEQAFNVASDRMRRLLRNLSQRFGKIGDRLKRSFF
jgi:hypothetical protein